jgi:hypothetical protein
MAKSIYLDSSDFSDLSLPEARLRPEDKNVLSALRTARQGNTTIFILSPPLLSEAVHATEANKIDATRRANLMRELCGKNTVRYPTDICTLELNRALDGHAEPKLTLAEILSGPDEWFGMKLDIPSTKKIQADFNEKKEARLKELPRRERRRLASQFDLSKPSGKQIFRQTIKDAKWTSKSYGFPLNLIDEDRFIAWVLGTESEAKIRSYLYGLLSDPYFLFAHAVDETGHRQELYSIVRKGAESLSTNFKKMGQSILELNHLAKSMGAKLETKQLNEAVMSAPHKRSLVEAFSSKKVDNLSDKQIDAIINKCPSVGVLVHAWRAYVWTLIRSNLDRAKQGATTPKAPTKSDFGDFVHIIYSPYVDLFRCDSRFAEHLKGFSPTNGKIVGRRPELIKLLA